MTRLPRIVISVTRPDFEVTATYKLLALMTGVTAGWTLWVVLGYLAGGPLFALAVAILAPLCGYAAIQWIELAGEVREDTVLFFRLQGRPDVRKRFARMRSELASTFRRLEKRWGDQELPSSADRDNVSAPDD